VVEEVIRERKVVSMNLTIHQTRRFDLKNSENDRVMG
jgi:hypothetical protein